MFPSDVESDFPTIDMIISQALVVGACPPTTKRERRFVKRRRKSLIEDEQLICVDDELIHQI